MIRSLIMSMIVFFSISGTAYAQSTPVDAVNIDLRKSVEPIVKPNGYNEALGRRLTEINDRYFQYKTFADECNGRLEKIRGPRSFQSWAAEYVDIDEVQKQLGNITLLSYLNLQDHDPHIL